MYCMQCFLKSKYIKSRTFNDKNRWIIKKVMVFKKLIQHLATRGTYSPGDWRCDEAWREQTLVYPSVMCQQRLIYCTWELNIMKPVLRCLVSWLMKNLISRNMWVHYVTKRPDNWMHCRAYQNILTNLPEKSYIIASLWAMSLIVLLCGISVVKLIMEKLKQYMNELYGSCLMTLRHRIMNCLTSPILTLFFWHA